MVRGLAPLSLDCRYSLAPVAAQCLCLRSRCLHTGLRGAKPLIGHGSLISQSDFFHPKPSSKQPWGMDSMPPKGLNAFSGRCKRFCEEKPRLSPAHVNLSVHLFFLSPDINPLKPPRFFLFFLQRRYSVFYAWLFFTPTRKEHWVLDTLFY